MRAHASFAGLLAGLGLAVALAACASGQGSQQPAAHPSANPAQVARQFGQCVRDHGDPSFPMWTGPCKRFNPQGRL